MLKTLWIIKTLYQESIELWTGFLSFQQQTLTHVEIINVARIDLKIKILFHVLIAASHPQVGTSSGNSGDDFQIFVIKQKNPLNTFTKHCRSKTSAKRRCIHSIAEKLVTLQCYNKPLILLIFNPYPTSSYNGWKRQFRIT